MEPLPLIAKFFSFVGQQKRQLSSRNFVASIKSTYVNTGKEGTSPITCNFCGCPGHSENMCYLKHAFPPTKKTCAHNGKIGYTIDVCYRKHGYPLGHKLYNSKNANNIDVQGDSADTTKNLEDTNICLTSQQYHTLLNLLQQYDSGQNSNAHPIQVNQVCYLTTTSPNLSPSGKLHKKILWIFNFGATNHVCVSLNDFSSYQTIKPISVKL